MSASGTNERRGKGFAGLDSMVSDVSEDIGRAATAPVESAPIPTEANAKLDFSGNDWECKRGFRRNWNECVPL